MRDQVQSQALHDTFYFAMCLPPLKVGFRLVILVSTQCCEAIELLLEKISRDVWSVMPPQSEPFPPTQDLWHVSQKIFIYSNQVRRRDLFRLCSEVLSSSYLASYLLEISHHLSTIRR